MSQQFGLLESNPAIGLKNGIYQDITERFRDSTLSEHLTSAVLEVFNKADDKSLFSLDIEALSTTRELKSALGLSQFRFLQSFDFSQVNRVLDLSEDFGGVSSFISDQVGQVESLKIDPGLAQISANRCANKHNVYHISADIEELKFPNKYYDLIVIGQLEALKLTAASLTSLLKKLQFSLSDHGTLVLSGMNNQRLNKWFDPHSADSDDSIEFSDLYWPKSIKTAPLVDRIDRKQIRVKLLECNFASIDIHAGFSNDLNNKALFSEDYLTASVNGVNHFYELGSIENPSINEFLVYKRLVDEKHNLVDYANHFVILAGSSSKAIRQVFDKDFTHFPNSKCKPQWQVTTSRVRAGNTVQVTPAYPDHNSHRENPSNLIVESFDAKPFHKGRLLIRDWLQALLEQDHRHFENLVQEYSDWLNSEQLDLEANNKGFDLIPSKIVLTERAGQRNYHPVDRGWGLSAQSKTSCNPEFLLFRALFCLATENKPLITSFANRNDIYSIGLFIVEYMPNVHHVDELGEFAELEHSIQLEILNTPLAQTISQTLSESLYPQLQSEAVEANAEQTIDQLNQTISHQNSALIGQSHRLKLLRNDNEHQALRIAELLDQRADIIEKYDTNRFEAKLRAEIKQLHERLHAQHVRNDELHGYLLMRPSTRAKRVTNRMLNRLTGKPIVDHQAEPEATEPVDHSPLPSGELIGQNTEDYQLWISENSLNEADIESAKAEIETMAIKPVFSILVPIYNTDPEYLLPMIESVQKQIYPHWQLCLVDDCSPKSYLKQILEYEALQDERISIQLNDVNQGISVTTNDALAMAKGDYIALLDHDDEISIDALYENAKVINATPDVGLIYSDEDKIDMQGERLEAYFKPDYSPDLLQTNNYICHFTVIKKSIADELGGFREGMDGSQDHDIIIRAAAAADRVVHIPKILYHWRKIPGSTAVSYDSKSYAWEAGRKAVEDQLQKDETGVRVEFGSLKGTYRVFREIKGEPLVSIIIPFKDKPQLLDFNL